MADQETEMKALIDDLQRLEKPAFSLINREELKKSIMNRISVDSLAGMLKESLVGFALSVSKRAQIKERVFAAIENHSQKRFFFSNFFAFNKKLVSAVLLLAIFFGAFNFLNVNTRVVRAATFTVLKSYEGEVLVNRFGTLLEGFPGMQLYQNDAVYTGADGRAVIEYFDDSVSRLAGDTQLIIKKLRRPSDQSAESNVEVNVVQGVVWSTVLNVVGTDSSFVLGAQDIYASARKAAFNVKVNDDELEIGVFSDAVDVSDENGTEHLLSGKKMFVKAAGSFMYVSDADDSQLEDDKWVKENLEFDRKYLSEVENRLLAAKAKAVGVNVEDDISFDTSLRENVVLFLTFDNVKEAKMELDLAEKQFIAAQIKLHDKDLTEEKRTEAEVAIGSFAEEVKSFYALVDEVANTDVVYAEELEAYANEKIGAHKKDLSVLTTDAPGYVALKVIDELELLRAEDEEEVEVAGLDLGKADEELTVAEDDSDNVEVEADVRPVVKVTTDVGVVSEVEAVPEVEVEAEPQPENLIDGPYGVTIRGDKPLSPLLEDIN